MRFLNVKTNALRRNANKEFTLHSSTNRDALCEACASFNACNRKLTTLKCKEFIPVIRFSVNAGLRLIDKPINTIRTGQAWFKRLDVGSKIALWDGVYGELLNAVVTELHWYEDKSLFLGKHAQHNHIVVSGVANASDMESLLKSQIGSGFYKRSYGLTAVYFRVIK